MSDPIKSADLCERCRFEYLRCKDKICSECVMEAPEEPEGCRCKCLNIEPNTPCPYFEEDEK